MARSTMVPKDYQGKPDNIIIAVQMGAELGMRPMQSLINIGVNTGVLPTKGLTLPFMSYGRSSLLMTLVWFGLVLRVHHETAAEMRSPAPGARRRAAAGVVS
jgi:cell division protein FtsW